MDTSEINNTYGIVLGKAGQWISGFIGMLPNIILLWPYYTDSLFLCERKIALNTVNKILSRVTSNKIITKLLKTIISIAAIEYFIALTVQYLDSDASFSLPLPVSMGRL